MAVKLISLRGMHEDEMEEIRGLLDEHHFSWYETPAGNWGISMPAIWLHENTDLDRAKAILDKYQEQRGERVREEYERLKEQGMHPTFWSELKSHPIRFVIFSAFILFILYVSTAPFVDISL